MDERALLQWLDAMDFGLFKDFPNDENDLRIQEIDGEAAPELWVADANYNAAKYLTQRIPEDAKRLIDKVINADPTNIHAWCNIVMFNLRSIPTNLREAQAAATKVVELQNDTNAKLMARVHKANFLCMTTDESWRDRGLKIFAECLDGDSRGNASFHYFYLKALVRKTKIAHKKAVERSYFTEIIGKFFDQCVVLFEFAKPLYQQQVFLFLADLQRLKQSKDLIENETWESVKGRLGLDQLPDVPFCLEKLEELERDNPGIPVFANLYSRVGSHYLDLAQECKNKLQREKLLKMGLEHAVKYKNSRQSRILMGPHTCASIVLELWALKYYEEHKDDVHIEQKKKGYNPGVLVWKFLTRLYHTDRKDTGAETRPLLEEVHEYMLEHYDAGGNFKPIHPRVMSLLGDSSEAIELLYDAGPFIFDHDKVTALEHKGLFYESRQRNNKAIECFEAARQHVGADSYERRIARAGLKRLCN